MCQNTFQRSLLQEIRKQTNYFFNLENSKQPNNSINKLIDDKGNTYTNKDQILKHIAEFYTKLFTEEPSGAKAQQKLLDSIQRRLPSNISDTLEGEIDIDECYQALSKKSPVTDGLHAEFYTMFWNVLRRDLV